MVSGASQPSSKSGTVLVTSGSALGSAGAGIVHHVPDWDTALTKVVRVLKPGGRFYFEEVTRQALDRRAYRKFLEHPRENRFSKETFPAALERRGIRLAGRTAERFFGAEEVGFSPLPTRPTIWCSSCATRVTSDSTVLRRGAFVADSLIGVCSSVRALFARVSFVASTPFKWISATMGEPNGGT